ncbi:MAG: amidohydrolase family protein [Verrucomicrobia bacterium]|nr:amidohydrolase family protein [Verrucomicrobiota bacterium]
MKNTRRQFLHTAALGAAAGSLLPSTLTAASIPAQPSPAFVPPKGEIVDWHTHWLGPTVVKLLSERKTGPRYFINAKGERFALTKGEAAPAPDAKPVATHTYDIAERLRHLDEVGVRKQLLGVVAPSYDTVLSPEEARPLWRAQNDDLAELVRKHPTRFFALATLPTARPDWAAEELERAHRDLGFIGATLPLDAFISLESARHLTPIFKVAQKFGSHLYIHRGAAATPGAVPEVGATNAYFGLPTTRQPNGELPDLPGDHAWARSTLITSTHLAAGAITLALTDLLDPYPDVTVQHTMIGGSIAQVIEAVEQRTERAGQRNPRERLRRIYLDTGATGRGPRGIALAAKVFGADRILFGSDYGPWPTIQPFVEGVASAEISADEKRLIYSGNGQAILKARGRA